MIIVVFVAIVAGAALGVACSALYVSRDHAVGWLVTQTVEYRQSAPVRLIGAENVHGEVGSRLPEGHPVGTRSGLDATVPCRTIPALPGAGTPHNHD